MKSVMLLLLVETLVVVVGAYGQAVASSYTVHCGVSAYRAVIVDDQHNVIEIDSNTKLAVQPRVFEWRAGSQALVFNGRIRQQYQHLIQHLNLSKPGVVYRRKSTPGFWRKPLADSVLRFW